MEDVNEYIESGILELYVLDQLTAQEKAEVEVMCAKNKIIKDELKAIEIALESYALENAIVPSASLADKVLSQFDDEPEIKAHEPKIVPLHEGASNTTVRTLRFALVACVGLLVISVAMLFSVYSDLNVAQNQIATLNSQNNQFANTVSKLEFENSGMGNRIAMIDNNEWKTVKLAGVNKSPDANMFVFWNKNDKRVVINYAAMKLPATDKTHEFQLWALVDGKPVSLGVFDNTAKQAVLNMQTIEKAQAFAVTIEPTGGSVNPTMEQMVVMGAITI